MFNEVMTTEENMDVCSLCCQGQCITPTLMFWVVGYVSCDQFHLAHGMCGNCEVRV